MVVAGAEALDAVLLDLIESEADLTATLSCDILNSELAAANDGQDWKFVSGCEGAAQDEPMDTVEFSVKIFDEGNDMDSGILIILELGAF